MAPFPPPFPLALTSLVLGDELFSSQGIVSFFLPTAGVVFCGYFFSYFVRDALSPFPAFVMR